MRVHCQITSETPSPTLLILTRCWPEVSVPDPSTVVRLPTASSANPRTDHQRGPNGARAATDCKGGHTTAHGLAEIVPRPRPIDSSGAWNPSFHATCPRLSAAWRRSQGRRHTRLTRPTTCAAPVVQPPAILPPRHSRHSQSGSRIHVLIIVVPSIAAPVATALSRARKSSRTWSGMSGFGPRSFKDRLRAAPYPVDFYSDVVRRLARKPKKGFVS